MVKIAHIINVFPAEPGSDWHDLLSAVQESMRTAKRAATHAEIELFAVAGPGESVGSPEGFTMRPSLARTVNDVAAFRNKRPLPLLKDILDTLHDGASAEYLIYTNADIVLMPDFYNAVARLIAEGHDAMVINRRTIPQSDKKSADLPLHYSESGTPHRGYDCFVFKKDLYPHFVIGNVCIGTGHSDLPLICSMIASARSFLLLKNAHLTFHFGDDRTWQRPRFRQYLRHNDREAAKAVLEIAKRSPRPMRPWHRFLLSIPLLKNALVVREFQRMFSKEGEEARVTRTSEAPPVLR